MSNKKQIKVIAIVGATASGKTAYSIELAKKLMEKLYQPIQD